MTTLSALGWYKTIGGTPGVVAVVVGAFVTLAVSSYYAKKSKITKELGWTPLGINPIVTGPVSQVSEGLALIWKGTKTLETPYSIAIRVTNVGSREILGEGRDYQEPLTIGFADSIVYEATITRTYGTKLTVPVSVLATPTGRFEVSLPTLNSGAWAEIEMIADGRPELPVLSTLLVGETRPIRLWIGKVQSRLTSLLQVTVGASVFLMTVAFALLGYQSYSYANGPSIWPILLMSVAGLAFITASLFLVSMWYTRRQRLRVLVGTDHRRDQLP